MAEFSQLTLSVQLPDDETFESYKSESNGVVVAQLKQFLNNMQNESNDVHMKKPNSFYMFGLSGIGKSHLLHASSAYVAKMDKTSVCLSCSELKTLPIEVLNGLENINLICLDDIQLIAGDELLQQAVFDLYNRVVEQNNFLLISGDHTAQQLCITLPDLVSRLLWGYTEQLKPLNEQEKSYAIKFRASQRGLVLTDDVIKFLLNHLNRDMKSLITSLDLLDNASMSHKRKITIPFVKEILINV